MPAIQSMLSALSGTIRVTIGREPLDSLRRLSDNKRLQCPQCRAPVVLRAGAVLAPHFAHLPGAVCAHPHAEPETEEHRAGKSLLARWLSSCLPQAEITLEAPIIETGQRADVLLQMVNGDRAALEYQCADLTAREWRRRHHLYRKAGIRDLWFLGGSRLTFEEGVLCPRELERALLLDGAPLLFLDTEGLYFDQGMIARFRSATAVSNNRHLKGALKARPLESLRFPHSLLDWPSRNEPTQLPPASYAQKPLIMGSAAKEMDQTAEDARLLRWLRLRHGVTEENMPAFFGMSVTDQEAFGCTLALWQACVYYRWIQGRVGEAWWLEEVNIWARRYMPIAIPTGRQVWRALQGYQELLAAAGLLTVPYGKGCARVQADFLILDSIPDPQNVQRVAAYRRLLARERK
jgi:hypothetical protein